MADDLLKTLAALREDGTLTDCKVFGEPPTRRYGRRADPVEEPLCKVHRLVLAMHSEDLLCCCDYVDGTSDYTLSFSDYRDDDIERLVSFVYTLDYDSDGEGPIAHARMWKLAEEYNVHRLSTSALAKFTCELSTWNLEHLQKNDLEGLELVVDHHCNERSDGPLCEILIAHMIDIGAFGEDSPIRDGMLRAAESWPSFGAAVIKALGRRERELKTGRG